MNELVDRGSADLMQRPVEELAEEICAGAARIASATARWLGLVAEFDRREGWGGHGILSCAHWLGYRCGLAPGAAREHVRVARALAGLPAIAAAFTEGRLSYSKVRALTRVADADTEADLLEIGLAGTAAHVEKIVRGWRRADRLNEDTQDSARFGLQLHWDEDGSLRVSGRLCAEDGAMLLTALQAAAEQVESERPDAERPDAELAQAAQADEAERSEPTGQAAPGHCSQAGALLEIARTFLDPDPERRSAASRHQVVVHVDADVLAADTATGQAHLEGGPALSAEQVARIGCDASLVVMLRRGREVLDIGRSTRSIPASINRALWARDGGCRFPSCQEDRRSRVQGHHIRFWSRGGRTALWNLVLLCAAHHRLIHHAGFTVVMDVSGQPIFRDPSGRHLDQPPPAATVDGPPPAATGTLLPFWDGKPMNLDYVIAVLLGRRSYVRRQAESAQVVAA